jgi:tetratricopeptide (TPR) repeat protein
VKKISIFIFIIFTCQLTFSQTWRELVDLGLSSYYNGNYYESIGHFEKSLKQAQKEFGKNHANYATSLNNLGMLYKITDRFEDAEKSLLQALELRAKVVGKVTEDYCVTLNNLGTLYNWHGDYVLAEKYFLESYEISNQLYGKSDPKRSLFLNNLAGLYMDIGKYDLAEEYYLETLQVIKTANGEKQQEYITCLGNLARLYFKKGDYVNAGPMYEKALELRRETVGEKHPSYALALNNTATYYDEIGNYDLAEQYYLQALDIVKASFGENHKSYATYLHNLGLHYKDLGNLSKSEECISKAMKIRGSVLGESHPDYAASLNSLGLLYEDMKDFEKAETTLQRSLALRIKIFGQEHPAVALSLNNLATVYRAMGRFDAAEKLFLQALDLDKKLIGERSTEYVSSLSNLAELYINTERYTEAEKFCIESIAIKLELYGPESESYATELVRISSLYDATGKYKLAEDSLLKALKILKDNYGIENPAYQNAICQLIDLLMRQKRFDEAVEYLPIAIEGYRKSILDVSSFLSNSEMQKFLEIGIAGFEVFESFEKELFHQYPQVVSDISVLRLFMDGALLRNSSNLRAQILESGDTSMISNYEKWIYYRTQISDQMSLPVSRRQKDLTVWVDVANELEKDLIKKSPLFDEDQHMLDLNIQDLQNSIKEDEIILQFISYNFYNDHRFTDSVFYAVSIINKTNKTPVYVPLFEEKKLSGLYAGDTIRTFANLLYNNARIRNIEREISYSDSLYKLILEPIEPYLKNVKHIYYSPSGILHNLTFDALRLPDGKYLSDKFQLSRLSGIAGVSSINDKNFIPSDIALFGGLIYDMDSVKQKKLAKSSVNKSMNEYSMPDLVLLSKGSRGGDFQYLPGSKKEVDAIGSLFTTNKINTYDLSGELGLEEKLKSFNGNTSPTIIHLSTHGYFFPDPSVKKHTNLVENTFTVSDDPLFRSGLILTGGNYVWSKGIPVKGIEDGILTAYEVSNLYLPNTKLVVMSACETGKGDINNSEGVYGLQRAFKIAGVDYIIVSLWQVLDKETSDFMILFYQNLLTMKSIPDAFRSTQDTMKNKYRDEPYKWAGFVLIR